MLGEMNPPSDMLGQFTDPTGEKRSIYKSFQDHSLCQNPICFYLENVLNKITCKKFLQTRNQFSRCLCWFQSKLCLNWEVRFQSVSYSTPCTAKSISTNCSVQSQKRLGNKILTFSCLPCIFRAEIQCQAKIFQQRCKEAAAGGADTTGTRDCRFGLNGSSSCFFPQLIPLLQHFLILNIISLAAVGAESFSYVLRQCSTDFYTEHTEEIGNL